MTSGIYLISNKVNGKVYVGSSVDCRRRFSVHRTYLRKGVHSNKHLQAAWNAYGEMAFEMEVVKTCEKVNLLEFERGEIACRRALDPQYGYNIRTEVSGNYGWRPDADHREVMKAGLARYHANRIDRGEKQVRSPPNFSTEAKLELAKRNTALFADPEHGPKRRAAISSALAGKKKSPQHIAAMKEAWIKRKGGK